ncbi:MAG TPA: type III-A CRISPR-associated RAMP protein Csm3 [Candidatus Wunengus sp. YC63]|uniref:type III-A CRISPR-associated RAMP protein Csm3 n=1 Tax=Candidatus Wunengus sp. YC63 TaxID=3367699 RepID=UPI00402A3883
MQFLRYKELKGKINLLSGLHIGGNKDNIEIGGIDNPVIKNPITGLPYIPGSSIKGKMRFLLEWKLDKVTPNKREPHSCSPDDGNCPVCRIFGNTDKNKTYGPTRLIVSDCNLILSTEDKTKHEKGEFICLEDKVENRINRLTGAAIDPRHIERVPAGLSFDFGLTYKIFKIDTEDNNKNIDEENWHEVQNALYYLQEDALGGSGSRGYGKIEFSELKLDNVGVTLKWNGTKAELI